MNSKWGFYNENNVPGRLINSNCGFYTENITSSLHNHLQTLAQKSKSYINDTNHFLNTIKKRGSLPDEANLCAMDVSGLYPNIPHREGLASLHKFLETRDNKQITSDALAEVEKVVLKNNMTFQQKCETVIAKKFEHLYAIFFMVDFEEKIIESLENKPMI